MTKWIKYKLTKNDWQKDLYQLHFEAIFMKRYKYFLDSLFFVQFGMHLISMEPW